MNTNDPSKTNTPTRRELLTQAGAGFGALAAAVMLGEDRAAAATSPPPAATVEAAAGASAVAQRMGKAKRVIYLFMHGGVSHVDSFDPKPALNRWNGQPIPPELAKGLKTSRIDFRKAQVRQSPWAFKKRGDSGIEISDLFPHTAERADDLVVIRSCFGDAFDHAPGMYLRCTGSQFLGRPSLGSWLSYGLGSENKNLPSFVVMSDGAMKSGAGVYGAGFLPSSYQGTVLKGGKSPILHLATPTGVSEAAQKATIDFVTDMDRRHLKTRAGDTNLEARLGSYELAYRMQAAAPEAVDLGKESEATKRLYGVGKKPTDDFGRKCLLARRLVERGVRFVQLYAGTHLGDDWDNAHDDLVGSHNKMAAKTDKPVAALLADLKSRGLLDSTLVVWGTEFGRTPLAEGAKGRDHHPYGFSMWMAGGGIKGGQVLGATDEFGLRAVESPFSINDVHATILRIIGVDHTKLTFNFQSREYRLTDVHGEHEFTHKILG